MCLDVVLFVLFAMSSEFRDTQRKKRVAGTLSHSGAKERNENEWKKITANVEQHFSKAFATATYHRREHFLEQKALRNVVRTTTDGEHEVRERRSVEEKQTLPLCCFSMRKTIRTPSFSINRPQKCASDRGNPLNHYS